MNSKIANILKGYLEDLTWVEKIAGLTQVMRVRENDVEKRIPISCDLSFDNCQQGCYDELVPNSNYRSIIYFEDVSLNLLNNRGNKKYYQSTLRLVCWLNYKKIPGGCGKSGDYVIDIIRAFPSTPVNLADLYSFNVEVVSQASRTSGIFGAYTYNEFQTQYLMLPYDYFALTLRTEFYIDTECEPTDNSGCLDC